MYNIPALFLLVLFTRGGESPGNPRASILKLEKNSDPSLSRRATAEREEGERKAAEASSDGGRAESGERVAEKRAGGERHGKN